MVNRAIRYGIQNNITSKFGLCRQLYAAFRRDHPIYAKHIVSSFEIAASILKNFRRRVRRGLQTRTPFVRRLFLKTENQAFRLDRRTGSLSLPIRAREHIELVLPLSAYHRRFLDDDELSVGSLTVLTDRVILILRKERPAAYTPAGVIALDTNESSLDGVYAEGNNIAFIRAPFPEVRRIQQTHFRRRRALDKRKSNDLRTRNRLVRREARRERQRVRQRLHRIANAVVDLAEQRRSAIVLEDLAIPAMSGPSRRMNRRLGSWPRSEIQRQIEYKAQWRGVPVVKVNPKNTSRKCPICGWRQQSRTRASKSDGLFECWDCGWSLNRQLNAGLNILKTALASEEVLARAVWFQPGALRHDAVIPLYSLEGGARQEPNAGSLVACAAIRMTETEPNPIVRRPSRGRARAERERA